MISAITSLTSISMLSYYRPNAFFKKYMEENGESALLMIYTVMRYQFDLKDK